jgi:cation diffusion facilitator family transporter
LSVAHRNSHHVHSNLESGARLALTGIAVNVVLAAVKIFAGIFGHAYVLIADGVESTLDILGSLIIWSGLKLAAKPPDDTHPYGHGKAEPLAAIVVSMGVVIVAIGLAIESVHGILTPHSSPHAYTLFVLVGVIAVKEVLFRIVNRAAKISGSTAIQADAWHHRSDAVTSVAAFLGISVALAGPHLFPGLHVRWECSDDWAALFACGIIAINGWLLFKPAMLDVMDTAPSKELETVVRAAAGSVPGVERVEQCRIRKMGIEFFVDLHVEVDGDIPVREGHRIAHEVKDAVRDANPTVADVLVHIEPRGT